MTTNLTDSKPDGLQDGHPALSVSADSVRHAIEHAIHYLPSQGPIAIFVHHNTLHAFEEYRFDEALQKGYEVYRAQPYLSEARYRQEVERGRIHSEDLDVVLAQDLGQRANHVFLGETTVFHLRRKMLEHVILSGADNELRWFMAETDALERFRSDIPVTTEMAMIDAVRRWIMRNYSSVGHALPSAIERILDELFTEFPKNRIEHWNEATWRSFTLNLLYKVCQHGTVLSGEISQDTPRFVRQRDIVLAATGKDCDVVVHDLLTRFLGSFTDQGFSQWIMPHREQGMYQCFLKLYCNKTQWTERWTQYLTKLVLEDSEQGGTAIDSILRSLTALGVPDSDIEEYVKQTLLALPGWSGMVWQLESNAAWTPQPAPTGSLTDLLAIRLLLDRASLMHEACERLPVDRYRTLVEKNWSVERVVQLFDYVPHSRTLQTAELRCAVLFQVAQLLNWAPNDLALLTADQWQSISKEIAEFNSMQRRRIFHAAYERRYRVQALDAIHQNECDLQASEKPLPVFQMITCIDDREESLRRHLEEVEPRVETFGAAGFYAVPMYFRSASDAHYLPLCPIVIKPKHFVDELGMLSQQELQRRRAEARRVLGKASHQFHLGSRSLAAGTLTSIIGSIASLPMVARVLAPRLTSRARNLIGGLIRPPRSTALCIEHITAREDSEKSNADGGLRQGFTLEEMSSMVERLIGDLGLKRFSRLIVILGHGSSSLNNPHESAYNCGACGGGRGGPNARAFAMMANDLRVRAQIRERGVFIPDDCVFLGGYHNTCSDQIEYFDIDRLPPSHQMDFLFAAGKIDEARARNAKERTRRFESASLSISPDDALKHVEARSEDLAQARPEYNHATNAVCFVGRRIRTRGLFMDRRSFLTSYDPTLDDESSNVLNRILQAAIPVCAGISLEYYFSTVDNLIYGCGSKLPHNITSLLGVMEGAASDLRTGLSQQMVEIHEPMRILFVIESTPERMLSIMSRNPGIERLICNEWVQLATLSPDSQEIQLFERGRFVPYQAGSVPIPTVAESHQWYRGWRNHLGFAKIVADTVSNANSTAV